MSSVKTVKIVKQDHLSSKYDGKRKNPMILIKVFIKLIVSNSYQSACNKRNKAGRIIIWWPWKGPFTNVDFVLFASSTANSHFQMFLKIVVLDSKLLQILFLIRNMLICHQRTLHIVYQRMGHAHLIINRS